MACLTARHTPIRWMGTALVLTSAYLSLPAYPQSFSLVRDVPDARTGEVATEVVLNASGIYVVGSRAVSGEKDPALDVWPTDYFLRKFDAAGKQLWIRRFGGFAAESGGVAVNSTGVYVAGSTVGALPGQTDAGKWDAFVRKYDFEGNELWTRQFGTPLSDFAVAVATDGTYVYVAGRMGATPWTNTNLGEGYIRKHDPQGVVLWTRSMGGLYAKAVAADERGVYVAGFTVSGLGSGPGFMRKFSTAGDDVWTRTIAAPNTPSSLTLAGGAIYVGGFPGTLSKYGPSGNELWSRRLVPSAADHITDYGVTLAADDSGVYAGSAIRGGALPGHCMAGAIDNYIKRFDPDGNEVWSRQFGTSGPDGIGGMAIDASGVYLAWDHPLAPVGISLAKLDRMPAPVSGTGPHIRFECVVNAASYEGGGITAGEIVTIFGSGIGPSQGLSAAADDGGSVISTLSATRVLFNGIPAPVLYASETQTTAVVPDRIADGTSADVQVEYLGVRSNIVTVSVAAARPGLFAVNGSGRGQAIVFNRDGTPNSDSNSALAGTEIVLYATGVGITDPVGADGSITSAPGPRAKLPAAVVFVSDDGDVFKNPAVAVEAVPNFVPGLFQVRVRLPEMRFRSWSARLQVGPDALAPPGWEDPGPVSIAAR